jgi:Cft2 family RNA processing exonuclease
MYGYGDFSISLDRRIKNAEIDFISHAHSDHISAAKSSKNALLSSATMELINAAYGINVSGRRTEGIEGVRLISAGHILGSRQLVIEGNDGMGKAIYSGDFQMEASRAAERIEIESADTLIIDSTYPQRELSFEDKSDVENNMVRWAREKLEKGIVLFNAYAIGKAQELIKVFNEYGIEPVVSKKISYVNRVYTRHGVDLKYVSAFGGTDHEPAIRGTFVGITEKSPDKLKPVLESVHRKRVFTAVATGFAKIYTFNTDAQFGLSDHADFRQRLEYIEGVSPKRIFTYGRDAVELASVLSKNGYDSKVYTGKTLGCRLLVEDSESIQV